MSSEPGTPTPETDAAMNRAITGNWIPAAIARSLERRLAASQAELDGYKADRIAINARNAELYAECERLLQERETLRVNIDALVAGPMMYHHKMDASDIRAAEAFDRCRELTLANFATHFALSDAIRAAMQAEAEQGAQG